MPGYSPGLTATVETGTTELCPVAADAISGSIVKVWWWGPAVSVVEFGIGVFVPVTTTTVFTFYGSADPVALAATRELGTVTVTASHRPAGATVRRFASVTAAGVNPGEAVTCVVTTPDTGAGRVLPYCLVAPYVMGSVDVMERQKPDNRGAGSVWTVAA